MTRRRLRVLFAVQGEGRGHMTQALALGGMLRARGHAVVGCLVGASRQRGVPDFFRRTVGAPVETFESPTFVAGAGGRIRPAATVLQAAARLGRYGRSLDRIGAAVDRTEPDVVVSFYEGLVGAYGLLRVPDAPVVAVGHQFMMGHAGYPLLPGHPAQRLAMEAYTRLAGAGAAVRLALSLYAAPPDGRPGVRVVPPLLRSGLFALAGRPCDGSILAYLMDPSMAPALVAWSDRRPDVRLHVFTDADPHEHSPSLTFHGLSGRAFLERMAVARGVICTAGFESVSEAMWLGKPLLMVPTPNHYEQQCNAADAAAVGAGMVSDRLDLDPFLDYLDGHRTDPAPFRAWVSEAEGRVLSAIEEAAGLPPPVSGDGLGGPVDVRVAVPAPAGAE